MDYDWEDLREAYEWEEWGKVSLRYWPCIQSLCMEEESWVVAMLEPAEEQKAPDAVTMELIRQTEDELQVELTNQQEKRGRSDMP